MTSKKKINVKLADIDKVCQPKSTLQQLVEALKDIYKYVTRRTS